MRTKHGLSLHPFLPKKIMDIILSLCSYLIVGIIATVVEWAVYYVLDPWFHINTYIAVAIAFIFSTFANWISGRYITFKEAERKNLIVELIQIYGTSIIGLFLNELIMYLALSYIFLSDNDIAKMISKVAATGIVFFYNFAMRYFLIYNRKTTANNRALS